MKFMLKGLLALCVMTSVATGDDGSDVLVFGGTGRLGAPMVRLLVEAGHSVTVFARPTSDRSRLAGLAVSYVIGDLTDADSVVAAVDGKSFRVVIDATARDAGGGRFYDTSMRNMLRALASSHVRQFILLGSVGAGENIRQFPNLGFERMRDVMDAKGEAEALLRDSGIDYTIIRSGIVKVDGTPATGTARLTEDVRVLGTVTRPDLAALAVQCLDNPACLNKIFHAVDD